MQNLLDYYQNIPLHINPIFFTYKSISLDWYSLMYLLAISVVYGLLAYRNYRNEGVFSHALILDLILACAVGAFIGGRLGYVILYNPVFYWHNPLSIISPFDQVTGEMMGIYGMSYHGGLLGVAVAIISFTKDNRLNFWRVADFMVPAIPAGYFFGRVGNFLNLELYGRATESWIGMYFPLWTGAGSFLRYPSQLFEAFFEGILLFVLLWSIRNIKRFDGYLATLYLMGYGLVRFGIEFFREPDPQIGFIFSYFSLGQLLSLGMFLVGLGAYFYKKHSGGIIEKQIENN